MSPAIPTLGTDRLVLRPFGPQDFEPYAEMMADPGVARFLTLDGKPQSRGDAWRGLAALIGCWTLRGFGVWAVTEASNGDFVGRVGPWQPEGWPGFEVGWGIAPDRQGRGYATEAAAAAVHWAFTVLGQAEVVHIIRPDNTPSQAVARRLGARIAGQWDAPWGARCDLWATERPAFEASDAFARHIGGSTRGTGGG
jgi:RimJ/RimL family protein N-acetyltransferase